MSTTEVAKATIPQINTDPMEPRRDPHLPRSEYDAERCYMNGSLLVQGNRSMRHLWHAATHQRDDTPSMMLGRAIHTMLLEPEKFSAEWDIWSGGRRAGKEWDAFKAAASPKEILTVDEARQAADVVNGVRRNKLAMRLLEGTDKEVTYTAHFWGMRFKGRMDAVKDGFIVDLKTTRSVEPSLFGAAFCNLHYDQKLAIYRDLYHEVHNELPRVFIIAVETDPPNDCVVIEIDDHPTLDHGANCAEFIADQAIRANSSGVWHGVGGEDGTIELRIPNWHMPERGW